jgi:ectoine hydroxylase-related dioxygenase (phytanoyl-CoA dioxygenase family)
MLHGNTDRFILQAKRISKDIKQYKNKEDFYNEINDVGYVIFNLPDDIDKQINDYGIENLRNDFNNNKNSFPITKMPGRSEKYNIDSKYTKAIDFFESKNIEEKFNKKLSDIFKSIHNMLMTSIENLNDNITNISSSILNSTPVSTNDDFNDAAQHLHSDYKIFSKKQIISNNFPLAVMVALEDETAIRILLKSHKLFVNNKGDDIKLLEVILNLKKSQILIFHPNLIHSGWNFKYCSNIRLHLYLDNYDFFKRHKSTNRAWWFTDKEIEELLINKNRKRSLANLKSMNNHKNLKFSYSRNNIRNYNNSKK